MTATGPRHSAPGARHEAGQQGQDAATSEPQHRSGRPPEYVIEIWVSPQLRERSPGRPLSLSEALQAGRQEAPRTDPEPDAQPEIEP